MPVLRHRDPLPRADLLPLPSLDLWHLLLGDSHVRPLVCPGVIKSVEWTSSVETGENYERLHVHIWLTVHHYSQVQINRPVISVMFKEFYNGLLNAHPGFKAQLQCKGRPYCNVKLLPTSDWAMVLRQYIHKAMAPGQNAADFLGEGEKDAV